MSLSNQAFVKSYARGRRAEGRPAGAGSGPAASDTAAEPTAELSLERSTGAVGDRDAQPGNDGRVLLQLMRSDGPAAIPPPHQIKPSTAPTSNHDSQHLGQPSSVEPSSGQPSGDQASSDRTMTGPEPSVQVTTVETIAGVATFDDSAPVDGALQHIHTAYDAFSWQDWPAEAAETAVSTAPEPKETVPSETDEAGNSAAEIERLRVDRPEPIDPGDRSAKVDSSNEGQEATPRPPFRAAWEVDVFDVPGRVADLFFEGELFQQIAHHMNDAVATGLRSILVTSSQRGEGRSSVAIGIAMAAAAAGIRVALLDADAAKPTLVDDLRLEVKYGWVDALRGGLPLKEIAVHAVEDNVTLIPLMMPGRTAAATADEISTVIRLMRDEMDLVIVDGPCGLSPGIGGAAAAVDTSLIVRDMSRTNTASINDLCYRLRDAGVQGAGIVENFVKR